VTTVDLLTRHMGMVIKVNTLLTCNLSACQVWSCRLAVTGNMHL